MNNDESIYNKINIISELSEFTQGYNLLLVDLWGVIHDGEQLYPGIRERLEQWQSENKFVVFISNAPRKIAAAREVLANLGIGDDLYDGIITSGEAAKIDSESGKLIGYIAEIDRRDKERNSQIIHKQQWQYIFTGLQKDLGLLDRERYNMLAMEDEISDEHINQADFWLCAGMKDFATDEYGYDELIAKAVAAKLPMLCINPDLLVVRQTGERVSCAGALARQYQQHGGDVFYYGKPYHRIYELLFDVYGERVVAKNGYQIGGSKRDMSKILAIGDNLSTDIAGANNLGIDSILVSGGILGQELKMEHNIDIGAEGITKEHLIFVCKHYGQFPTAVVEKIGVGFSD